MARNDINSDNKNNKSSKGYVNGGPAAPKDSVEKRCGFYVMQDTDIEASSRNEGKPSQEIYLEGRLKSKARLVGSVRDEDILGLLENCQGFQKLVHSIGVSVKTTDRYKGTVNFVLQNWGKTNKYETGTTLRVSIPTDGKEIILKTADYEWSADDDVPGKFAFEFENVGEMARASIKLYLNDDYYVPEMAVEPPVDFESDKYRDMIARSLMNRGNNKRLKNAIEKAESGDDVTIAYIGGSITQGAAAKPINTECYAYQSYLKFREMFGKGKGNNVHFIKAGVGGTSSELGMIRYERDILKDGKVEPDVVIVEFAVNDAGDETKGVCYESLVLKILSAENKPAVVLLFSVFENDWNLQDRLSPVGKHYNLPMVSVKDAVVEQFRLSKEEGNVISKRQYFYDIYHPTNDGHRVMADCLACLFSEIKGDKDDQDDIIIDKEPVIGNYYRNVRLLDRKDYPESVNIEMGSFQDKDRELQLVEMDIDSRGTPQFPYNWMYSVLENKSFKIEINSSSLILVFKDSGDSEFGKADVFVDGKKVLTADPHINNWTHCNTVILYQEEVSRDHQIEIKMTEGDEGKRFTILGFGYTR